MHVVRRDNGNPAGLLIKGLEEAEADEWNEPIKEEGKQAMT